MGKLTPKYRRRLWALWAVEAAVVVYNVWAPSFAAMALPMAGCWLYVMACAAREYRRFDRAFSQRYPHACQEWKNGRTRVGTGPCLIPGDRDLCARWEELRSVIPFILGGFAGFVVLFFALLGRMMVLGPYE